MNWYKKAQSEQGEQSEQSDKSNIFYLGDSNYSGAVYVEFDVNGDKWMYQLKFADDVDTVAYIATKYSAKKALVFAKQHKINAYKIDVNGRIEREEYTKDEIKERADARKAPQEPVQQNFDF